MGVAVRKHLLVLVAYTIGAIVLSWPLVPGLFSTLPGVEGDAASYVWALGWAKAALELQTSPFRTDYIYYPLGGATQLMWAVSLVGFLSLPLQFAFGLIAAHNVMYLAATVLTGYGTFLLAEDVLAHSHFRQARTLAPPPAATSLPPYATFVLTDFLLRGPGAPAYVRARRGAAVGWLAPFAAGLVFAFAPLRLGYGLAFLNLYNTEFIPFYLLFLVRAFRRRSWRESVMAGLFLGLNAYVDFQIAAFLILFTALYAVYTLFVHGPGARGIARWLRPAGVVAVTGLVSLIVAAPLLFIVANDFAAEGGNYIQVYKIAYSAARSYDLAAYVMPNARSGLYAGLPLKIPGVNAGQNAQDGSAQSPDRQVFLGYAALALAVFAVWRRWRDARIWLAAAVLFALFSLGPSLHVLGQDTGIPLPYLALHEIPIVNHIRIPMRYGIVVFLALAMLVGIAFDELARSLVPFALTSPGTQGLPLPANPLRQAGRLVGIRILTLLLPLLILLEVAVVPYPVQPFPIPAIYEQIARVPGDFAVLEIPTFNWRAAAAVEAYQPIHHKRILRAYTNRIAPGPAEYLAFRGTPIVVRSLRVLEGAEEGELGSGEMAADRQVRDEVLHFYDLRYALVHRQFLGPEETAGIDAYLRGALGARQIYDDGETVGYELPQAQVNSASLDIDLRQNLGQMYAGRGWQFEYPQANWQGEFDFVWAQGEQSELYFPVDEVSDRELTLHAYAVSPQRVSVVVNDERVGEITLGPDWRDYSLALPARVLKPKMNVIRLEYGAPLQETVGVTEIHVRQARY